MSEKQIIQEEQLSTKDLLLQLINLFKQLFKEWRLLMIGAALGSLASILIDLKDYRETLYWGEIQFNLESGGSNNSGLGAFAGMASAFGIQGNMNNASDLFSGANFNLLLLSRALYDRAFMKEITVNGKKVLFANYYKDSSGIAKNEWAGTMFREPNLSAIKYRFSQKDPKDFTRLENEILQTMYDKLSAATFLMSVDKASSIMSLKASSISENLAKTWVEVLLATMEEFYVEVKTKKTKDILSIQERRLAELGGKLSSTDKQVASANYQAINAVDPLAPMRTAQVTRNNQYVAQQYYTQLATVENLKLMLLNQTPFFMIIEPVRFPLTKTSSHVGDRLLFGAILGLFILAAYILFRNTFRSVMASANEN